MTNVIDLVQGWDDQQWLAIRHLPTDSTHQRNAFWKAHRRTKRRIRGRAARVAHHLVNLNWCAQTLADDTDHARR